MHIENTIGSENSLFFLYRKSFGCYLYYKKNVYGVFIGKDIDPL